jgi:hypothetical protein
MHSLRQAPARREQRAFAPGPESLRIKVACALLGAVLGTVLAGHLVGQVDRPATVFLPDAQS